MRKLFLILGLPLVVWLGIAALKGNDVNSWEVKQSTDKIQKIIVFGDSLTTGYAMSNPSRSYPHQLAEKLQAEVNVIGFNGITSQRALSKIDQVLKQDSDLVIVTLGGNDILKSVKLKTTIKNLDEIFTRLSSLNKPIVFTEVLALLDTKRHEAYMKLCRKHGVLMITDISKGILFKEENKCDAIHPNERGAALIAEKVYQEMLKHLVVLSH